MQLKKIIFCFILINFINNIFSMNLKEFFNINNNNGLNPFCEESEDLKKELHDLNPFCEESEELHGLNPFCEELSKKLINNNNNTQKIFLSERNLQNSIIKIQNLNNKNSENKEEIEDNLNEEKEDETFEIFKISEEQYEIYLKKLIKEIEFNKEKIENKEIELEEGLKNNKNAINIKKKNIYAFSRTTNNIIFLSKELLLVFLLLFKNLNQCKDLKECIRCKKCKCLKIFKNLEIFKDEQTFENLEKFKDLETFQSLKKFGLQYLEYKNKNDIKKITLNFLEYLKEIEITKKFFFSINLVTWYLREYYKKDFNNIINRAIDNERNIFFAINNLIRPKKLLELSNNNIYKKNKNIEEDEIELIFENNSEQIELEDNENNNINNNEFTNLSKININIILLLKKLLLLKFKDLKKFEELKNINLNDLKLKIQNNEEISKYKILAFKFLKHLEKKHITKKYFFKIECVKKYLEKNFKKDYKNIISNLEYNRKKVFSISNILQPRSLLKNIKLKRIRKIENDKNNYKKKVKNKNDIFLNKLNNCEKLVKFLENKDFKNKLITDNVNTYIEENWFNELLKIKFSFTTNNNLFIRTLKQHLVEKYSSINKKLDWQYFFASTKNIRNIIKKFNQSKDTGLPQNIKI